jgi:predicted aspartyl protease
MKDWTEKPSRLRRFGGGVAIAISLLLSHPVPAAFSFSSKESPHSALIAQTSSNNLLAQVQDCIQKQSTKESSPPPDTQAIATQCMFSVVMLNPDGSVRPDARERIAEVLKATGVKVPRPSSKGQANIALRSVSKQPIFEVPVLVGGQPFSFILDTGTGNSVIDHQVAKQLRLQGSGLPPQMLGNFVFGQQKPDNDAKVYSLPPLRVGKAQVNGLFGLGLSTEMLPFKTGGILGLNFLSRFDMLLNPQTRRLSLLNASKPVPTDIPLRGRFGVMTTPSVFINDQGPFSFLVDTGAAMTIVSDRLAEKLALTVETKDDIQFGGLGGQEQARQAQLERLSIQTHQIPNLKVLVLNSKLLQTLGVDGVIGQDILNRYIQHWRFGLSGPLGDPQSGSLNLAPVRGAKTKPKL